MKCSLVVGAACAAAFVVTSAYADTLAGGSATINFYESAWTNLASGFGAPPVLTLSGFFNQAQAGTLSESQLLITNPAPSVSYTNEVYGMNGSVVTNAAGQYAQPTTFNFTPGQLTNATGVIGLGSVARFDVYGGAYGELLFGDYTLQYSTSRLALGGSGWYLEGNIPPAAAAFDLLPSSLNIVQSAGSFTISGELGVSYEVANYLFSTPSDTLADVGNFTFTGTDSVPEPSSIALVASGLGMLWLGRKRRRV